MEENSFPTRLILARSGLARRLVLMNDKIMDEDDGSPNDLEVFDISKSKVEYSRSRDAQRVTAVIHDPAGISEMKLYLVLCLECEKLERRLGISEPVDEKH